MTLNVDIPSYTRVSQFTSDENILTTLSAQFLEDIRFQVNQNIVITGSGSPESVITAQPVKLYIDTAADALFYKKTGIGNTGWVAL